MSVFEKVYEIVQLVPKGRVITYGAISRLLSGRLSAQGVGWALKALPSKNIEGKKFTSANVPWHRVINSEGKLSKRSRIGTFDLQMNLLHSEGVKFDRERGCIELARYEWRAYDFDVISVIVKRKVKKTGDDTQGKSGAKKTGAKQSGAKKTGATQSGATQSGANQSGTKQSGANQSGAKQTGATQSGAKQTGATQSGAKQTGTKQSGANQSGAKKTGA